MEHHATTQVPLTRIQKLIGKRMLASKHSKPCFYLERKADVTELMARRHKISKALGVKVTSNTFLIRSLALAVHEYPLAIGRLEAHDSQGQVISIPPSVNVGFAVNSPQGLLVPVIRDAHEKTLAEIAAEERALTRKARSNKISLTDLEGETIALSNLGAYGTDAFWGIVPLPTSTILSVGNPNWTIVPRKGQLATRKMMSLSLAVDHRVLNGAYAAEFLCRIAERLQDPTHMI